MVEELSAWRTKARILIAANCKFSCLQNFDHPFYGSLTCWNSFVAYRALPHLNNKHTVFGRVIDDPSPSSATLNAMEIAPVDSTSNRPKTDIRIKEVTIFVDPFEEFMKQREEAAESEKSKQNGKGDSDKQRPQDDDLVTWTGKRVRTNDGGRVNSHADAGVGKYLKAALASHTAPGEDDIIEYVEDEPEPEHVRKKAKAAGGRSGVGNFDSW
jgi:peptidyl-prolyl cis-trans isomerase-like protein 2